MVGRNFWWGKARGWLKRSSGTIIILRYAPGPGRIYHSWAAAEGVGQAGYRAGDAVARTGVCGPQNSLGTDKDACSILLSLSDNCVGIGIQALDSLACKRRVLLSGTPMQNHLDEVRLLTVTTGPFTPCAGVNV